ncbi:hypothetical protein C0J52_15946 [Blattella germanica]|nr:hypothetical protein C0J52_15946 [Blattella germanica]
MGNERRVRRILEGKAPIDYTGDDWKTLAQDRDVWRAYVRMAMNLLRMGIRNKC